MTKLILGTSNNNNNNNKATTRRAVGHKGEREKVTSDLMCAFAKWATTTTVLFLYFCLPYSPSTSSSHWHQQSPSSSSSSLLCQIQTTTRLDSTIPFFAHENSKWLLQPRRAICCCLLIFFLWCSYLLCWETGPHVTASRWPSTFPLFTSSLTHSLIPLSFVI